ncbi:MAG: site-specific recombinase [Xylophilus ampelinus]
MRRKTDLGSLLARLDPEAPLAARHLWLVELFDWIRGKGATPQAAVSRVQLLLDAVEASPELQQRLRLWWQTLLRTVDITMLLADFGFAPRAAFASEVGERLRRKLLPLSPETIDASELFALVLPSGFDAQWLNALDPAQLRRLRLMLSEPLPEGGPTHWQCALLDAITYCAGQVISTGFAPDLRLRMSEASRMSQPFHGLVHDVEALRQEVLRVPRAPRALEQAALRLRARLDACRQAGASVYTHLEDNGISVDLVFRVRQLRDRVIRIRDLIDCLLSETPLASATRLLARLVLLGRERNSVRALLSSNSSLLAAKVTERSAETGAQYITRDRAAYAGMLRKAAGGGALTAGTVILKFAIGALGLSIFWNGFWSGVMYAASFVLIQLLHCTLATKQPAMTAPALAAKLKEIGSAEDHDAAVEDFVTEVTHLVRSQVAAVLGNVLTVFPVVLAVSFAVKLATGHPLIGVREADYVLHSLDPAGGLLLFAAFTGVLLFAASLIAGWAENWFVLHRLDSAMRYNPQIGRWLGRARAARWSGFMRENISGFASNISLGLMLGLVPAFAAFFGLGLEARHVTLSTGQLAAAAAAYGIDAVRVHAVWWCLLGIPFIGALNLGVSFYCAFRLALRAHSVSGFDRARIRRAVWARARSAPLSFLWPRKRTAPAPDAPAEGAADAAGPRDAGGVVRPALEPVPTAVAAAARPKRGVWRLLSARMSMPASAPAAPSAPPAAPREPTLDGTPLPPPPAAGPRDGPR